MFYSTCPFFGHLQFLILTTPVSVPSLQITVTLIVRRFRLDTEVRCVGAHPPFWLFEQARVKPN